MSPDKTSVLPEERTLAGWSFVQGGKPITHHTFNSMRDVAMRLVIRDRISAAVPHPSPPKRAPVYVVMVSSNIDEAELERSIADARGGEHTFLESTIAVTDKARVKLDISAVR